MDARVIVITIMQKFGEKSVYFGWFMAIAKGGLNQPHHTQATFSSPTPLGLSSKHFQLDRKSLFWPTNCSEYLTIATIIWTGTVIIQKAVYPKIGDSLLEETKIISPSQKIVNIEETGFQFHLSMKWWYSEYVLI